MTNLYTYINNINPKSFYFYLVIILVIIYFFKGYDIKINAILGLIISVSIVLFLNEKNKYVSNNKSSTKQKKIDYIEPKSDVINNYDEIIDLLFSIQDFYIYNPQAYEEMINSISDFFTVYEDILKNTHQTNKLFTIADKNMANAINNLHSIIYKTPDDKIIIKKLHNAMNSLEKIMIKYMNEIYDIHMKNATYDIEHKEIYIGPKEHNFYNDAIFDFY